MHKYMSDKYRISFLIGINYLSYLSCSCFRSSQGHRYTAHSPGHSEHCSHIHTSLGILDRIVQLGMLHKEKIISNIRTNLLYHKKLHKTT